MVTDHRAVAAAEACQRDIDAMGDLPLPVRRHLVRDLAGLLDDATAPVFIAQLGLLSAQRVWPAWQSAFPDESRPMDLAQTAVAAAGRLAEAAKHRRELDAVATYLDNKILLGREHLTAVYAGWAAWAAARDAIAGNHDGPPPGESELEVSPQEWEPSFYGSAAQSGGASWDRTGSPARRREFWEWYLATAVPEAFSAAVAQQG